MAYYGRKHRKTRGKGQRPQPDAVALHAALRGG
jgi:hypothetical protein